MPLDWLGQLGPTMQQQIALQRALLALQREDEQIRLKTMPQAAQPALARGLAGGPTYAESHQPREERVPTDWEAVADRGRAARERALATQLRAAEPVTGKGLDIQGRAWARREEMVEERVVSAKEAFDRITTLDPAGQKVALNALRRFKPGVYKAMETEGYMSPAGELVQPKQEATSVQYVTADNGEMLALTTYPDGRIETEHTGVYPAVEAGEAVGPTISEAIKLEELGMKTQEFGERHYDRIIDVLGHMPRIGLDTVTVEGKEVPATAEHVNAWLQGYSLLSSLFAGEAGEAPVEGEVTMSEAQAEFERSTGEVKMSIQQKLGVPQTGEWDEPTEFAMSTYGDILLAGEPVEEGKPKFERQKKFWDTWLKTWGKVFKKRGSVNIAGQTREEWEATRKERK